MTTHGPDGVILCADDYALSAGVSRGIRELIEVGRLTATSAMVTFPRWSADASELRPLRSRASLGLHINLTVGTPLGKMQRLAPSGQLPDIATLTRMALAGRLDPNEITEEVARQLEAFIQALGYPPDHVDGHQHVHALPGVRKGVLDALDADRRLRDVLIRDPGDLLLRIARRRHEAKKAAAVATLAYGFGREARRRGYATNRGFSGFSAFETTGAYETEFRRALIAPGACHMVMCHPGYGEAELLGRDPVIARRDQELEALHSWTWLPAAIATISRPADGPPIDWQVVCEGSLG